jgi:hypothetical protein
MSYQHQNPFVLLYIAFSNETYQPNSYWCTNGIYSTQYSNIESEFKTDPEVDVIEFKLAEYPIIYKAL